MIYTSLKEAQKYSWPEAFQKAFDFLGRPDLADLEAGTYEIDGKDVYALVQKQITKPVAEKRPEAHNNYIDIQFLICGEEKQGYALRTPDLEITEAREAKDTYFFAEVPGEQFVSLKGGEFTVYFSGDVHRPNCAAGESMEISKVVVKIKEALVK